VYVLDWIGRKEHAIKFNDSLGSQRFHPHSHPIWFFVRNCSSMAGVLPI
jgi:hypothetical protein